MWSWLDKVIVGFVCGLLVYRFWFMFFICLVKDIIVSFFGGINYFVGICLVWRGLF